MSQPMHAGSNAAVSALSDYQQQVIFGLAREGQASYQFLRQQYPEQQLLLADDLPFEQLPESLQSQISSDNWAEYISPSDLQRLLQHSDQSWLIFKTPGIPSEHPLIQTAHAKYATITSNTDFFFQQLAIRAPAAKIIGITGTKGKSTTTSLIYHLLQVAKIPSRITGNIGTPPLTTLLEIDQLSKEQRESLRFVVFELSSHQLRELKISPQIAVILNITPEHLDYYADFNSYLEAKAPICSYQAAEDVVIYNPEFATAAEFAQRSPGKKRLVSLSPKKATQYVATRSNDLLYSGNQPVIPVKDVPLVGEHNLLNILPALAIGNELGIDPTIQASAIHSFQALPHRLSLVAEIDGVRYFNDSQATNPEAAIAALQSFPTQTIHLVAGGSDKGLDLEPFAKAIISSGVKTLVLFPPMGAVIADFIENQNVKNAIKIISKSSMQEAVSSLKSIAKAGDVVLLAPGCASFGMFKNYQDRGNQFVTAVLEEQVEEQYSNSC
ncbi:MAG: UDP-N-acetylmuramoyl-L-alanine--D-glutamate ligase [Patescibacteria group bacterium]